MKNTRFNQHFQSFFLNYLSKALTTVFTTAFSMALTLMPGLLIVTLTATPVLISTSWADEFEDEEEEEIIQNPLTAQLYMKSEKIQPGAQKAIEINIQLVEGYRAYLDKFKLKWDGEEPVKVGQIDISPVTEFKDTFSGKMKKGVSGKGIIKAILELPSDFKLGPHNGKLKLTYQACTEKHCLFPKNISLDAKLVVENNFDDQALSASTDASGSGEKNSGGFLSSIGKAFSGDLDFKEAVAQGMFFSFLFIFLAGVLTSLTPCIYPMIPITLAVIGAKSTGQSKGKSLSLSIVYVLGIALTFSTLGVVAALTGSLFGAALSSPWVVGSLATVFVVLGLSMYGLFELQAPAGLRNKLGSQKSGGYFGALFAGLVSGVVAGPCVGPVLIGVLTHVGEKQSVVYGFSLLFTYAIGMGVLFIVLGTSSSMLNKLPRAGGWMDGVKFVFGTMMIAMALYYIAPLASDKLFYSLLAITIILISSHFGAFSPNEGLSGFGRLQKGAMLTAFVIGVVFMIQAVFGANLIAGINSGSTQIAQAEKMKWQPFSESALVNAKQTGQPVIVDFFAEWCGACKELDKYTFTDPNVKEQSKDFTLLKFDATEDSEELARLKKKFKIQGLPTILFISPDGEVIQDLTLTGFEEGDDFVKRMKKVL